MGEDIEIEEAEILQRTNGNLLISTEEGDRFWVSADYVSEAGITDKGEAGSLFVDRSWAFENRHIPTIDQAVADQA